MNATPTPEQIEKLPKWAQEHIKDLDRRAFVSERSLREYRDSLTPSEFFVEEYDADLKKMVRKYVQTNKIAVERNKIHLEIILRQDENGIDVTWWSEDRLTREIALVPKGFNSISIVGKDQMR